MTSILAGFFELDVSPRPALLERLPSIVVLAQGGAEADPWIAATVQLYLSESAKPGPASVLVLQRLSEVLFIHALRSVAQPDGCREHSGLRALSDPAIHRALELMHAHVEAPWTVATLAKRAGVSRSSFAARFTELVGEPPLQYLARWRVARAAELLRDTDDSIAEIASRVGYESVPSFGKAFKRWHGTSPGRARSRGPRTDDATP